MLNDWIKIGVKRKLEVAVCLLTTKTDMAVSKEEYCASSHWRPVENNTHIFFLLLQLWRCLSRLKTNCQLPLNIKNYIPAVWWISTSLMIMISHIHLIGFRSRTTQMGLPQPSLFHPGSSESFFHSWKINLIPKKINK